jgi:hypothetical protein
MTDSERKWLETALVGGELAMHGPKGMNGCGYADLERAGYVRVEPDGYGFKFTRLK